MSARRFLFAPILTTSFLILAACGGESSPTATQQTDSRIITDTADPQQWKTVVESSLDSTAAAARANAEANLNAQFESGLQYQRIAMSDGVELEALISIPEGPGPHPLVVLPSSWGFNFLEYLVPASEWTDDGYVVISYTSRGFWLSDGQIDLAGPKTINDLSEVIDWALVNTPSDPDRIGAAGSSYGAGIPVLTAARDSRIKAIAAMSGFTDPISAIYVNNTISYQSVLLLDTLATVTGELDSQIQGLTDDVKDGFLDPQAIVELSPARSAILNMDGLNRNKPAILQLSAWNDGLFLPYQHVDFYRAYEGDIAMELIAGDHITNDIGGWIGLPSINWERSKEWLDFYLKGGPAINKKPLRWYTVNTDRLIEADTLEALAPNETTYTLDESGLSWLFSSDEDGVLTTDPSLASWDKALKGGVHTGSSSGTLLITGGIQGFTNSSPLAMVSSFDREGAAVWRAESQDSLMTIAGTPRLEIGVTPSRKDATIVAYLYDEGAFGISSLISYGVYTLRDVIPGQNQNISFDLNTVAWDVEAGNNLVLVIDTDDARFTSETREGDTVTLSSSIFRPSSLTIPTR